MDQDQEHRGLSRVWAPIDRIAEWVQHGVDVSVQQRLAVLIVMLSIPLMIYGPFTDEPILVYEMSAVALTLTGITWLASLQAARAVEEAAGPEAASATSEAPPPPVP